MNRIKFDAQVLDLYARDYEYLQDSIEADIQKLWKSISNDPSAKGVIRGFDLAIDTDPTKIKIYNDNVYGYAVNSSGSIIEYPDISTSIELSDYTLGTTNFIYVEYSRVDASQDKITGDVVIGEKKAIDYSNYSLQYDRSLEAYSFVVLTLAEYSVLSDDEKNNLMCLGSVEANGAGVALTTISDEFRDTIRTYIPDGSVTVDSLDPNIQIPQTMVDKSAVYDDTFAGTVSTLEDDLNVIRKELRLIKGTASWTTVQPTNLSSIDNAVNRLHNNGVLVYGDDFDYEITSSGYAIKIKSGKALINGSVFAMYEGEYEEFSIPANIRYISGDLENRIPDETYWADVPPVVIQLDNYPATDLNIVDNAYVLTDSPYVEGEDYTFNPYTGQITTISGGHIINETVAVFYEYEYPRYDIIEITSTGVMQYVKGQEAANPTPPQAADANAIRLYTIYRTPLSNIIVDSNVEDSRIFLPQVEDKKFTSPDDYSIFSYVPNKIVYHTSSGTIDTLFTDWNLSTVGTKYLATTSKGGSYIEMTVYANEGDGVALYTCFTPDSGSIKVEYESIPNSGIYDSEVTFSLYGAVEVSEVTLPILESLTQGYHNFKVTTTSDFYFELYGVVIGTIDSTIEYYDRATLNTIAHRANAQQIEFFDMDRTTSITYLDLSQNEVVSFPSTGTPAGKIEFNAHYPNQDITFKIAYATSTISTGNIKIDADIYVNGTIIDTMSETFTAPEDTDRHPGILTNIYVDKTKFTEHDNIVIVWSRDNTCANNMSGNFYLIDIIAL